MKKSLPALCAFVLLMSVVALAQDPSTTKPSNANTTAAATISAPAISANSTPIELARAALAAQGGDKFKNLKSMMLIGSADLFAPNSAASIPGKFVIVTAGDKVRIEIDARPMFSFKQLYDGQRSSSSMPGVE